MNNLKVRDLTFDDDYCTACGDDTPVLAIQGGEHCYACGNTIVLCAKCIAILFDELKKKESRYL